MKKLSVFVILCIVAGIFGWRIYQKLQETQKQPKTRSRDLSVPVDVAPVEKRIMRDFASFSGTLQPQSQFIVAPKIAGRLKRLSVNIGDEIVNDQEIALLDDDEYVEQVEEAQAELNVAKANVEENKSSLEMTESELRRLEALGSRDITSRSQLDIARAQQKIAQAKHKVAQAQVAQKEAALNAMKIRLGYSKIKVSWPDKNQKRIIGERFVHEGAMLSANSPIVSLLDINSLIGAMYVIERDYTKVKVGQDATLTTDAFPGRSFVGKVKHIAPLLRETSRQGRVEILVPNTDWQLKPGMFINVRILFEERANVCVVPITAVAKRNNQQGVFVIDGETMLARFVPITSGISEGIWVEVREPRLEGMVATLGQHLLADGSRVLLAGAKQESRRK